MLHEDLEKYVRASREKKHVEEFAFQRAYYIRQAAIAAGYPSHKIGQYVEAIDVGSDYVYITIDNTHCSSCGVDTVDISIPVGIFITGTYDELVEYFERHIKREYAVLATEKLREDAERRDKAEFERLSHKYGPTPRRN